MTYKYFEKFYPFIVSQQSNHASTWYFVPQQEKRFAINTIFKKYVICNGYCFKCSAWSNLLQQPNISLAFPLLTQVWLHYLNITCKLQHVAETALNKHLANSKGVVITLHISRFKRTHYEICIALTGSNCFRKIYNIFLSY